MNNEKMRAEFEKWFAAIPRIYKTDLIAWDAWQAAVDMTEKKISMKQRWGEWREGESDYE